MTVVTMGSDSSSSGNEVRERKLPSRPATYVHTELEALVLVEPVVSMPIQSKEVVLSLASNSEAMVKPQPLSTDPSDSTGWVLLNEEAY